MFNLKPSKMKKVILLALFGLFATSSFSSNTEPEKMELTNIDSKTSIAYASGNDLPFVIEMKVNDTHEILFSAEQDGVTYCLTPSSTIEFTLESGEVVKFRNLNGTECKYRAKAVYLITDNKFAPLSKSPVKSITYNTESGTIKLDNIADKNFFIRELPKVPLPVKEMVTSSNQKT